jgi:hypothetical protein
MDCQGADLDMPKKPGIDYFSPGADKDFEYPPCVDLSLIPDAKLVFYNSIQVAPGMPPPKVQVQQRINKGSCSGKDGGKYGSITIEGIFACCSPEEKISSREELLDLFSVDCGTIRVDSNIFEHVRVRQVSVSSSNYLGNVPYTISLDWVDQEYGVAFEVENLSSIIIAEEDEEKVTVTHSVSAQSSSKGECADCTCDISAATAWVLEEISETCPSPTTIKIPKNPLSETLNCPNIEENVDLSSCSHSISKTWFIYKNIVKEDDWDDNNSVTSTYCKTISEGKNQRQTINHSGNLTYNLVPSCQNPHDPKYMEVLEEILEGVFEKYQAYSSKVDERNITKSESPPSIQWSITFLPDPVEDERGKTIDDYCMSASVSGDGVVSISVNGVLKANENYPFSTVSRNCKCEAVQEAWDPTKYFPLAEEFYTRFKSQLGESLLRRLMGPCYDLAKLNPNPEQENDKEGKDDCSKSYSFVFTDKPEISREWNYSVDVTDPIERVTVNPLLNLDQDNTYKFCVVKTNEFSEGRVTVNGQRRQDCPDDPEWDKDAVALTLAQNILPDVDLLEIDDHCNTKTVYEYGKEHPSSFQKSFRFEHKDACQSGAKDFAIRKGSVFAVSRNEEVGSTKITKDSHSKKKKNLE